MQITIDTKKDSPEDIKKAIEFLKQFSDGSYNPHSSSSETKSEGLFGMFGEVKSDKEDKTKIKDEKEDETPQIEVY